MRSNSWANKSVCVLLSLARVLVVATALEEVEGPLELGPDVGVSVAAAFCHDSDVGMDYFSFVIFTSHHCSLIVSPLVLVLDSTLFTHTC